MIASVLTNPLTSSPILATHQEQHSYALTEQGVNMNSHPTSHAICRALT